MRRDVFSSVLFALVVFFLALPIFFKVIDVILKWFFAPSFVNQKDEAKEVLDGIRHGRLDQDKVDIDKILTILGIDVSSGKFDKNPFEDFHNSALCDYLVILTKGRTELFCRGLADSIKRTHGGNIPGMMMERIKTDYKELCECFSIEPEDSKWKKRI